jgi:preprotein translocase subunit YajC
MGTLAYAMSRGPATQSAPSPSPFFSLMPVILIFLIFYFLLLRPQRKKQEEHKQMVSQLKKNDEVITSGGIHGTIVGVKDDSLVLRVDDNVKIEVQKSAIAHLKKKRV